MTDDYKMSDIVEDRTDWGDLLEDYVKAYSGQYGLEVGKDELDSYPEPEPSSENEFLLAKQHVEREIDELRGMLGHE